MRFVSQFMLRNKGKKEIGVFVGLFASRCWHKAVRRGKGRRPVGTDAAHPDPS